MLKPDVEEIKVDPIKKLYLYHVEGRGRFPFDMLRYDKAWPSGGTAVTNLDQPREWVAVEGGGGWVDKPGEIRRVALLATVPPTVDRWRSFGWYVVNK